MYKILREQQTIPEENQVQISKNKIIKDRNNSRKLHFQSFLSYEFLLMSINSNLEILFASTVFFIRKDKFYCMVLLSGFRKIIYVFIYMVK